MILFLVLDSSNVNTKARNDYVIIRNEGHQIIKLLVLCPN